MKKRSEEQQIRKNKFIVIVSLVAAFIFLLTEGFWIGRLLIEYISEAEAEEMEGMDCWVFCQPDGIVNVRSHPKRKSSEIAWASCGIRMKTDGKIRNGYIYVYDIAAETTAGWISTRYVVYEEPKAIDEEMVIRAEGRVACRKWMDGKVVKWYRDGDLVLVHWVADGWAVTDRGYIRYEYLDYTY